MPTDEQTVRKRIVLSVVCGLSILLLILIVRHLRTPPQMGADEEVFKTVNALFTALTSKNTSRLDDCGKRLRDYREAGKLPETAAKSLDSIMKQAREGQWDPAARRLYEFMLVQRRDSK